MTDLYVVRGPCIFFKSCYTGHHLYFSSQLYKRQSLVSLELFQTIVCHGDIREPSLFSLATKLWGLAQKHGELDTKIMVRD